MALFANDVTDYHEYALGLHPGAVGHTIHSTGLWMYMKGLPVSSEEDVPGAFFIYAKLEKTVSNNCENGIKGSGYKTALLES